MLGTIINVILVLIGTALGLLLRKGIPDRMKDTVMQGLGLCVILIGAQGALGISGTSITKIDTLCVIVCTAVGSLIGSAINIEKHLDTLGKFAERKMRSISDSNIGNAFVTTSLVYCVGAMAIVGAINSGLNGDHSTLIAKGIIDGITAIFFTSTMGIGVALSAIAVLIYQGAIALLAGVVAPLLTDNVIAHMSAVGGLLIIGVGLNLFRDKHMPVGNMLPAIFMPLIYLPIAALF